MAEELAPQSPLDLLLVDIWSEAFGKRVGLQESLADLGATPSGIEDMMARVARETGRSLALEEWDPPGTIEALSAVLVRLGAWPDSAPASRINAATHRPRILTRNAAGNRPPFMFLHGDLNGGGFYCLGLAARLGPSQPFHALMPLGFDGAAAPASIEDMAREHLVDVRRIQPAGPYYLGGHCSGGLVAFELGRLLMEEGEEVAVLVLIAADVRSAAPSPDPSLWQTVRRTLRHYGRRLHEIGSMWRSPVQAAPADERGGAGAIAKRRRLHAMYTSVYGRALRAYSPRPYHGRVVLLWPEEETVRHPGDPTQGWGRVASSVEVRVIPGGHLTCVTTHVPAVASEIRRAIDLA